MKNSLMKRMTAKTLRSLGLRNSTFSDRTSAPFHYEIDHFYSIKNEGYVVHGWIVDTEDLIESVVMTDGLETSGDLLRDASPRERADVRRAFDHLELEDDLGFMNLIPSTELGHAPTSKIHLRFELKSGDIFDFPLPEKTIEQNPDRELYVMVNRKLKENGGASVQTRNLLDQHDSLESLSSYIRMAVDSCYIIDGGYLFISGWLVDADDAITSLKVKQGSVLSQDIRKNGKRYPRPDLREAAATKKSTRENDFGITVLVKFDLDEEADDLALFIETEKNESLALDISGASECLDVIEMSKRLLGEIDFTCRDAANRLGAVGEAIRIAYLATHRERQDGEVVKETFGRQVTNPQVTVIVPLYGRYDFMEYQLSQFAIDPDFQDVELIYVVDDPNILDRVMGTASDLYAMYGVPFVVVWGGRNRGFAGANNFGSEFANAETLLLLNSDVLPKYPGWLSAMKRAHQELDSPGAIAPALLYEDDSVQHAGMTFEPHPDIPELWVNVHEYKGLPASLVLGQQTQPKEVLAVTAACLMMSMKIYVELGGLDERYILGDFEDSDLCLKALDKGYKNYFLPSIELYHVERQSQNLFENLSWRQRITLYNCWEHTEKWGNAISALKQSERNAD